MRVGSIQSTAWRTVFGAVACLILLSCPLVPLYAGVVDPKLEKLLAESGSQERIPVIVSLSDKVNVHQFRSRDKKVRRSRMVKALKQRHEETVRRSSLRGFLENLARTEPGTMRLRNLWMIGGLALKARPQVIRTLAQKPWVEAIRLDQTIQAPPTITTLDGPAEWNLTAIGAQDLWDLGYTGQGVIVASVDTGVDVSHPDLGPQWRGGANSWFDANDPNFNPLVDTEPYDTDGHGTAVMGILVGGNAGGASIGVAPGAKWIAAKIFDENGAALESEIHEAFQWLLDPDENPDTDDAPDIVNNSWGFGQNPDVCIEEVGSVSFRRDVQTLKQAGIAVVFSAGNGGPSTYTSVSPANYPESFSVGAVDEMQNAASFSARGPSACGGGVYPSVTAPGDRAASPYGIRTADLMLGLPNPSYTYVRGTSFSAPHASGAMALLLSAYPDLAPHQLETALKMSAPDLGAAGPDNVYGYGHVDASSAHGAVQDFDVVRIDGVFYDNAAQTLTIAAASTDQPNVTLKAEGFGSLDWISWKNCYSKTFSGVTSPPDALTVISSGGGSDAWPDPATDTVTVKHAIYDDVARTLTVVASSSLQPDVTLDAAGYGRLYWREASSQYKRTFAGVASPPSSVTVQSSGGGSATCTVKDIVNIKHAIYDAVARTLTVIAASSLQPDVTLDAAGYGRLYWREASSQYRRTFTGVSSPPASVTVNSSGGGSAITELP